MAGDEARYRTGADPGPGRSAARSASGAHAGGGGELPEADSGLAAEPGATGSDMAAGTAGRTTAAAATATAQSGSVDAPISAKSTRALEMEFALAADVIYNRARASWLTFCHRVALFGAIMAGSTAATDLANARLCALLAAACAALDLVFDPAAAAAEHRDIARELLAIAADLHRDGFSDAACRKATDEEFRISAIEPAPYHAARDLAHNQAITALGRDPDRRVRIGFWRWMLAHLARFEGR